MQTSSSTEFVQDQDLAQQPCVSCRSRKRKCSRTVPSCLSCTKRKISCEYLSLTERNDQSTPDGFSIYSSPRVEQSIDFPTILFLDPSLLQYGQVELSQPGYHVPSHILHVLGDTEDMEFTASKYFDHIHSWMPFVSKKRFYEQHFRSILHPRPDIVLLQLSFKLITTLPPTNPRNPRTSLYHTMKHFYVEVEGSSSFSLPVVQAGILLALYELGHGIYPAAFLSVGACARYAHALGINVSKKLGSRRTLSLVEGEERRRVWWAIIILDRFASIGCPGRPFAAADPKLEDLLPSEDSAWDQGIVKSEESFTLSSPAPHHMSKFALLCQAASLLGQVLRNVSSESECNDSTWIQLDRTLQSMLTASFDLRAPDSDQIAFVYSALVALYTPWLHSSSLDQNDIERSRRATEVLSQVTERISSKLVKEHCFSGRDPETLSLWGTFFAYHICAVQIRSFPRNLEVAEVVKKMRGIFLIIDARWNVAGIYLQLLEAREAFDN